MDTIPSDIIKEICNYLDIKSLVLFSSTNHKYKKLLEEKIVEIKEMTRNNIIQNGDVLLCSNFGTDSHEYIYFAPTIQNEKQLRIIKNEYYNDIIVSIRSISNINTTIEMSDKKWSMGSLFKYLLYNHIKHGNTYIMCSIHQSHKVIQHFHFVDGSFILDEFRNIIDYDPCRMFYELEGEFRTRLKTKKRNFEDLDIYLIPIKKWDKVYIF